MSIIRRKSVASFSDKARQRLKKMVKKASYASHIHEFRLKGKHPMRLLGTPKDPWQGSLTAGSHILFNRFYCEGQILRNPEHENGEWQQGDIWQATDLNSIWQKHLHSFCWLRDLSRVVDRNAARNKAIALMRHWLKDFDQWHGQSWAPDIIGQRITSWMAFAPLILDTNDLVYRSSLLNCLARQARHLYHTGDDQLRGLPRIKAIGGLIMAGLYIPYGESWLKKGTSLLKAALAEEILGDGGITTRSPEELYFILRDLLMIRASYKTMGHNIPDGLDEALGRMVPMLKSLLHGDGQLALFNGTREQSTQQIAETFAYGAEFEDKSAKPDGEKSGFRRLQQGQGVVIMDAGPPADLDYSQKSHAGTLSFEMSYGKQRIIVNCGCARHLAHMVQGDIYKLSRSTAAHSTLILNDKNSSEILKDGRIGHGPSMVNCVRTSEQGHSLLEASHDGYLSRFGIIHHRAIYMNELGDDIRGEDILEHGKSRNKNGVKKLKFDIRFHLHPDITLSRQAAADRLLLRLPTSEYWQFQCSGGELSLEECLYFGDGARIQNTRQIVVSGTAEHRKTVLKWSLRRLEHNN